MDAFSPELEMMKARESKSERDPQIKTLNFLAPYLDVLTRLHVRTATGCRNPRLSARRKSGRRPPPWQNAKPCRRVFIVCVVAIVDGYGGCGGGGTVLWGLLAMAGSHSRREQMSRLPCSVQLYPSLCFRDVQEKLRDAEKVTKELQDKFGAEEAKSVEMAAELLTLVNQKTHLETVRQENRKQRTTGGEVRGVVLCGLISDHLVKEHGALNGCHRSQCFRFYGMNPRVLFIAKILRPWWMLYAVAGSGILAFDMALFFAVQALGLGYG